MKLLKKTLFGQAKVYKVWTQLVNQLVNFHYVRYIDFEAFHAERFGSLSYNCQRTNQSTNVVNI